MGRLDGIGSSVQLTKLKPWSAAMRLEPLARMMTLVLINH